MDEKQLATWPTCLFACEPRAVRLLSETRVPSISSAGRLTCGFARRVRWTSRGEHRVSSPAACSSPPGQQVPAGGGSPGSSMKQNGEMCGSSGLLARPAA
ncbi:Hypothetical predicted protein [Cloeon dipterum]|uniref:Uncharacterized protein n=1 Tax=Cloeon dipterum TaxID=197152 RepID=A0A8S1CJJ6_9INSE|nr:Hypothetical predicted protein [Cloeon dipterum]